MSSSRSARKRSYVVEYERIDVWFVEVEAQNAKEARRMVRDGEFELTQTQFAHYGGDGKVLTVERAD